MKVYLVYSIPKSPEYKLEKIFLTKEGAKAYIKNEKESFPTASENTIFDIQLEEIEG